MADPNHARADQSRARVGVHRVVEPAQPAPEAAQQEGARSAEPTAVLAQRALAAPGTLHPTDGRRLQRALGNRGVAALARRGVAGRKTARVQAKLRVGPAQDAFEAEADRMAAHALAAPQPVSAESGTQSAALTAQPAVQRAPTIRRLPAETGGAAGDAATGDGGFAVDAGFEGDLARASSGGQPLPGDLRARIEPAYGANFEGVRVHAGAASASLAESIQAKAFTHGGDIHFNAGEYNPDSSVGQRLIAHELTHVVQQGAATQAPAGVQRAPATPASGEAEVAVQRSPDGVIQRTGKRVNSLVAFWESQKVLNAPDKKPEPKGGGGQPQAEVPVATGGNPDLLKEAVAPAEKSGGGGGGGGALVTPASGGGGGGTNFGVPSGGGGVLVTGSGGGGGSGGALHTPSGGGAGSGTPLFNPAMFSGGSTGASTNYSSSAYSSSDDSSLGLPLGQQFPVTGNMLPVLSSYKGESKNSLRFLTTKVFQMGELAFFALTPQQRKTNLAKIGWSEAEIDELELSKVSKVKYLNTEEERADYKLQLGSPIKQGVSPDPWDTSGMFANGVGSGHAIFVMDPAGTFYAGRHKIAAFHHSSFLGGAPAASAGTLEVKSGVLRSITSKSGHYVPKPLHLRLALAELQDHGVNLSNAMAKAQDDQGAFLPEEPALDFLNAAPRPVLQPASGGAMGSSPVSASVTPASSSGWQPSTGSSGHFSSSGLGGGIAQASSFGMSEDYLLHQAAGGKSWRDALKALGLEGEHKSWGFPSGGSTHMANFDDLIKILKGQMKPDELIS